MDNGEPEDVPVPHTLASSLARRCMFGKDCDKNCIACVHMENISIQ